MIKTLIIISVLIYLGIGFILHLMFTYRFKIRAVIRIGDTYLEKELDGLEIAIICIFWIFTFPFIIKNILNQNKEDNDE